MLTCNNDKNNKNNKRPPSASIFLLCLVAWSSSPRCWSQCSAANSMPRKLHCLAQVSLKQVATDGVSGSPRSIEQFQVEEFLDLDRRRSSMSLRDERTGDISIYYNKLNAPGDQSERKFILYEPANVRCKSQRIIHWPLADLRKVAIYLHGLLSLGSKQYEDTPLGPSALVHAIEMNPKRFEFRENILSKATLGNVNVFASQVEFRTLDETEKIQVLVHTRSSALQALRPSDTLADAFLAHDSSRESIAENLRFVGACRLVDDNRDTPPLFQEHEFCSHEHILFGVHFDVIERHVEGTLVGRQLDALSSRYEFTREPHLQPVGIGCWDEDTNLGLQRSLLEGSPIGSSGGALRLSAQSVSTFGPSGTTFVAYDGRAHLLRLDRNGRVSVYDLSQAKAYHLVRAPGAREPRKCVVLDVDASSVERVEGSLVAHRDHVLEQLVGLRPSGDEAHYLGTRIVDHQEFEVYEKELRLAALGLVGVPILLQANKYKSAANFKKRLLATYYTQQQQVEGASEFVSLHYIELWEFDPAESKTRKLVNRVTFTEFAWSIGELEPTGGIRIGNTPTGSIFDLAPCRQRRAEQAQLRLTYVQDENTSQAEAIGASNLRASLLDLSDHLQQMLAESLEISRLNLANFKVALVSREGATKLPEVVASSTLIEMHTGLSVAKFLGVARHDEPEMHKYALRYLPNRHSLEECKLDSLEHGHKSNWLAYCGHLTLCVLLAPDGRLTEALTHPLDGTGARDNECRVYSFRYATLDQLSGPTQGVGALEQAQANEMRLRDTPLEFVFGYQDEALGEYKSATFRAKLSSSSLELLDPIGARLVNDVVALDGLSYSVGGPDGDARVRNANFRWLASKPEHKSESIFRHCQLACQLNEFCGSFSVCTSGKQASDCILSPLRLAGERLDKLIEAKRASRNKPFEFRPAAAGSLGEQIFMFEHQDGCSLHERDFLADFQVNKLLNFSLTLITGAPANTNQSAEDTRSSQETKARERHSSLAECAGLSFERSIASFTYCALESMCILEGEEFPTLREAGDSTLTELAPCSVHAKRATGAYELKSLSHLVVRPISAIGAGDRGRERENSRTSQIEDYKSRLTLRTFYTKNEGEECARECSLPSSACLSFDICQGGRGDQMHLCLLYSVRSPMAKRGAYLPLLKREQSLLAEHNAVLANNPMCNHFLLKQAYFETKLKHLLARERMPLAEAQMSEALQELENKIELADEALSKQEQIDALAEAAATAAGVDAKPDKDAGGHAILRHQASWSIHTIQLAVGLVIGSLGAAYKRPLKYAAGNLYLWAQFMMRPTQRDITPLVTRDQL